MIRLSKNAVGSALLLLGCAGLVSCSPQAEEAPPQVSPVVMEEPPAPEPVEPLVEHEPEYTAPLTGIGIAEPSDQRPLAVMVNNAPAARPQSGLSEADIVYEVLAEGGITRLVAFYQSGGGEVNIGPVRSIRPYLIELAESYGALPVHAGGSNDAYAIFQRQGKQHLDEITNAGTSFWRSPDRKAPHNLYTSLPKLLEGADKRGYPITSDVPEYVFEKPEQMTDGEQVTAFDIRFMLQSYRVSYTYDEDKQTYLRSVNGEPHIDLNNNGQLSAANVIVMSTSHRVLDDIGRLAVDLNSGGEALIFREGRMIEGKWKHANGDIIRFYDGSTEIPLLPGQTYIHIVPAEQPLEGHVSITEPVHLNPENQG
ncbi:DUF3048 domain-containing protein [Paenibacillus sp. P96]|uniref:DUF3048 domain-containing protein n=1 Tax=Paenibacillus zeirhizosphaerae TaxID=2987519 RepID=A0ABT9FLY4_9BACL|nr:DUF3048 domain-containing protein [Paenibacillus sp. P96]MDP4095768.1 DUF3048 domain-containing protein [Paenibacillus sp. P96]